MEILITGCSGYIGSNLILNLLTQGHHIFCISKSASCPHSSKTIHLQYDLSKFLNYDILPSRLDCIIHLAAVMSASINPSDMFLTNTYSTFNLLEYGKSVNVQKFIFASSGAVYGYSEEPLYETSPVKPMSIYGLTKYQSEQLIKYYENYFSTIILRLSFPYGHGQERGIMCQLRNNVLRKEKIFIFNNGNPKINPTYVSDVIEAINRSITVDGHHILNICGDDNANILELSLLIAEYYNATPLFVYQNNKNIKDLLMKNMNMKKILHIEELTSISKGLHLFLSNSGSRNRSL